MTTPEERDYIGEVICEDSEGRKVKVISAKDADGDTFVRASDYDELRQQLADVSHERDLLRAAQGWIKCGDRLPDDAKGDYLIVCESGEVALSEYIFDEADGWGFWYDPEATHWMPLPAAPSAEVLS